MALILVVAEDPVTAEALSRALTEAGHTVRPVAAAAAPTIVADERPDLMIIDLGRPDEAAEVLRTIRLVSDVPMIVAAPRRAEEDVINLLGAGADDCVTKPVSAGQVVARIDAVLRRARAAPAVAPRTIVVGDLVIHPGQRRAELDGVPLRLARREFDLLAYLAARAGQVISRRELMTEVWHQPGVGDEQTIDVHVSWLRRKLGETAARPRFLHTVRGVGVLMVDPTA